MIQSYKLIGVEKITQKKAKKLLSKDVEFFNAGKINSGLDFVSSKIQTITGTKRTFEKQTSKGIQYKESFLDLIRTECYIANNVIFIHWLDFGPDYVGVYKL